MVRKIGIDFENDKTSYIGEKNTTALSPVRCDNLDRSVDRELEAFAAAQN